MTRRAASALESNNGAGKVGRPLESKLCVGITSSLMTCSKLNRQILMKLSGPEDNVHILVHAKRGDIPRRRSGDILDSSTELICLKI